MQYHLGLTVKISSGGPARDRGPCSVDRVPFAIRSRLSRVHHGYLPLDTMYAGCEKVMSKNLQREIWRCDGARMFYDKGIPKGGSQLESRLMLVRKTICGF